MNKADINAAEVAGHKMAHPSNNLLTCAKATGVSKARVEKIYAGIDDGTINPRTGKSWTNAGPDLAAYGPSTRRNKAAERRAKASTTEDTTGAEVVAQRAAEAVTPEPDEPSVPTVTTEAAALPEPAASAAAIDGDLRREARVIANSMVRFKRLIIVAKTQGVHQTLGFASWTAYIADVISKEMSAVAPDDRREVVELLAGEGMSNRAIAEAVGVNEITVRRDKDEVRHDVAPEAEADRPAVPDKVTGLDGKLQPAKKPKPKPKPVDDVADEPIEPEPDVGAADSDTLATRAPGISAKARAAKRAVEAAYTALVELQDRDIDVDDDLAIALADLGYVIAEMMRPDAVRALLAQLDARVQP